MTEYDEVVHVETLEEYRAVLDKWFENGYDFFSNLGTQDPHEEYFTKLDAQYVTLQANIIGYSAEKHVWDENLKVTPFKEYMAKERGEVTYEVSEELMAFINKVKDSEYPASYLVANDKEYEYLVYGVEYGTTFERDLLRYLGGDDSVVFQLKDPLFMLKGKSADGDTVYFKLNIVELPTYTRGESDAFVASLKVITSWKTPFWEIVLVEA